MRKLFGTDGIRAVAGEAPLDAPTIFATGLALAFTLKKLDPAPQIQSADLGFERRACFAIADEDHSRRTIDLRQRTQQQGLVLLRRTACNHRDLRGPGESGLCPVGNVWDAVVNREQPGSIRDAVASGQTAISL